MEKGEGEKEGKKENKATEGNERKEGLMKKLKK